MIVKTSPIRPYRKPIQGQSFTRDLIAGVVPATGGLILGAGGAYVGEQAAQSAANYIMREGPRWVFQGTISPSTALSWLPYVRDQAFVSRVGAIGLGAAGFALGAYLLWPRSE